ncbi:hypothetical protein HAX54_024309 [Datura stramonium]|uniref:Uncharacterized protein n=1 Tax=Datura stramonium TaxID=4076 RepID=A0ABS8UZ93_DATST|nr:hypothetical protein [Datura stramonium]
MHEAENNVVLNRKYKSRRKRGTKSMKQINEGESQSTAIYKVVRQKTFIKWTVDLYAKLMKVVQQLGEERCFPKEILELMNVPSLTKTQVASHLQKCCRNNGELQKNENIFITHHAKDPQVVLNKEVALENLKPCLQTDASNLQHNLDQTKIGQEFPFSTLNTDSIFARKGSSIQQLYIPQPQVKPHYLSIGNSFNKQFLFMKNNVGGGLQQQHGTIFEMLGSQGLHGPIIGNTNYRPVLTFDSGYYHTQSDYNLDLDAAHGTTYSGSRIMFGTDVGITRLMTTT